MKIVPQNDYVLCRRIESKQKEMPNGFVYSIDDVQLYEVLSNGPNTSISWQAGDIVVAHSSGTKCTIDGIEHVLFKEDSLAGKVVE